MTRILLWAFSDKGTSRSPRRSAALALGVLIVVMAGLVGRLYDLQVLQHDRYLAERDRNSTRSVSLPGTRGSIYTEDGLSLAQTTFSGASLVVNPRALPAERRVELANRVTELFGRDPEYARKLSDELYARRDKYYYCIVREVPRELIPEVDRLIKLGELPAAEMRSIETREYPLGNFASHIVGFVGSDFVGLEGVERAMNGYLAAQPGVRVVSVDALGRPIEHMDDRVTRPRDGANVYLTLNSGIQAIVEDELRACVEKWDPVSVSIIVMETQTGAILGISNYPNFDPNAPGTDAAARKNISITDPFEPGSMFKPLIVCEAYRNGTLKPESLMEYTVDLKVPGRKKVVTDHGHEIADDKLLYRDGRKWVTVNNALVSSSNTVMTRIGLGLGCENLHNAVRNFGFGRRTGFDLGGPAFGESGGTVRPLDKWSVPNSIPSVSIGYEVQVTPMQMLNCFNAIANGGHVYQPWVVQRVEDRGGKVLYQGGPKLLLESGLNEVVTRQMMNETLKGVVEDGTAKGAMISQYKIAGKTGTAHKVKNGQYSEDKICSFVGYAPADNPVLSVIVVVNEARAKNLNKWGWRIRHYGGTVAAPTMSKIVLRSLKHLGVPEDLPEVVTNE